MFTGMRPPSAVSPSRDGDAALALVDEAEVLDVEDLGDGEAVVHLGAVDVGRPEARPSRRPARRPAGSPSRPTKLDFSCRYGWSVATPNPATYTGRSVKRSARSARDERAPRPRRRSAGSNRADAADEQTGGEVSTSSTVISFWKWAYGSRAPLAWFFTATEASISRVVPNSYMWRVANGANSTGAVSPRLKIGCPDAARDSRPSSLDLSRIFSTPMTSTTSWTPLATAIAPTRKASDPDGQAFSMRVQGIPASPIADGHRVAADALLAPQRAPLGRDERGLDLRRARSPGRPTRPPRRTRRRPSARSSGRTARRT